MKLDKKSLAVTVLSVFAVQTYAAGLERSPQQIDALFENGTYAELGYIHISPKITGKDTSGNHISDMAEDFQSLNYAVKTDLVPNLRLAVIYDEPFGAKVKFEGENNFIAKDRPADDASTSVNVKVKNVTTLLGYNVNKNVMVYGGPALQETKADVRLRGLTYDVSSGYNNHFDDIALGWVAGMSYAKPEMGILASLTYRSEIKHKTTIHEDDPLADIVYAGDYSHSNQGDITTPESFNLNLQTGLNQTTAIYAKMRYVPWKDFAYYPPVLKASTSIALGKGIPLVDYSEDQTSVELGLGKQLSPNLAISVSGLWDSGAGDPAPTLGPVDGYWGVGLGAKYNLSQNLAFSLGGRYMWFGDAKGELSSRQVVGDFKDNTGYIVGMKLSYSSSK
ncbi:OmpP1/FadL family transporter [Acinetobacter rongchengensis]|uniref:Aromatic hydrocarbon degradation protein n=1 Tax=Acinetobacter rongchengensis TaxID=2419601 RepID=A0A3A8F407_9GAMM|nr:outer membrane protein transport protein [Acinetobacter rongchengensis]RKG37780.1 aromatic hydrocarbon degradation protein [Acinetobacter rongchengensis]